MGLGAALSAIVTLYARKLTIVQPFASLMRRKLCGGGAVYVPLCLPQLKNPDSSDPVPSWEKLSTASGMAPNTIRDCYRQVLPYLATVSQFVPPVAGRRQHACMSAIRGRVGVRGDAAFHKLWLSACSLHVIVCQEAEGVSTIHPP